MKFDEIDSIPTPMSCPEHMQPDDAGLKALELIAAVHGIAVNAAQLRHAAGAHATQLDAQELELAARSLGLRTRRVC
ncbi:MAG TPA: cysteine peptidase family C39 domain-containing protein, partial [Pararobbsia sp.]|nr:cysteine peptidase family C39 domain-containing protein [Pararobbsia sp.]